jgi:hypothetical protein
MSEPLFNNRGITLLEYRERQNDRENVEVSIISIELYQNGNKYKGEKGQSSQSLPPKDGKWNYHLTNEHEYFSEIVENWWQLAKVVRHWGWHRLRLEKIIEELHVGPYVKRHVEFIHTHAEPQSKIK